MLKKELSWEPVRKGKIYCSPACGANCTWDGHLKAVNESNAMVERLGNGWRSEVSENMGWHWNVTYDLPNNCTATIFPVGKTNARKYHCLIGQGGSGNMWVRKSGDFEDPLEALMDEFQCMLETIPFPVDAFRTAFSPILGERLSEITVGAPILEASTT